MLTPRPTTFMPIWPPASEQSFDDAPEVRKARKLFRTQMTCLAELAGRAMQSNTGDETHYLAQEIAGLLHNISGTAAYFGESDFGRLACALEQSVRAAFTADLLKPLCARILERLSPPGED